MVQVNENGVISFEQPWQYPYPDRFPTEYYWSRQGLAVAPFWNDNDIRKAGAVRYVAYGLQIGDTTSRGKKLLDQVNKRIREVDEDFSGKWLLIAHWDHVHPSPHGDDNHRGILESELEKVSANQSLHYVSCVTIIIYSWHADQQLPSYNSDQFHSYLCLVHLPLW